MTEIPEHLLQAEPRSAARRSACRPAKAARRRAAPSAAAAAGRDRRRQRRAGAAARPPTTRSPRRGGDPRAPARAQPRPQGREAGGGGDAAAAAAAVPRRGRGRPRRAGAGTGRRRSRRSHPAAAHRRQVRLDPGRQGRGPATRCTRGRTCSSSSSSPSLVVHGVRPRSSRSFVNAPLLALANVNQTPNPSKAPWYFLGLQELLTMFHPMVAGVTIPGMGLVRC